MYIEWFLLDNTLMNYLILRTAGALLARHTKQWKLWLAAFCGGILAAIAFAWVPVLLTLPGKLLLTCLMGVPYCKSKKDVLRASMTVFVASILIGGGIYALAFLTGGSMQNGILLAAPPLRVVLFGAAACCLLPGAIRKWRLKRAIGHYIYPMRMVHKGTVCTFRAFLDTGNALCDPLNGTPVILLAPEHMPQGASRPIPCETVTGSGMLYALRPDKLEIFDGEWQEIHALIATSPTKIHQADALIGIAAFPRFHSEKKELSIHEIRRTG